MSKVTRKAAVNAVRKGVKSQEAAWLALFDRDRECPYCGITLYEVLPPREPTDASTTYDLIEPDVYARPSNLVRSCHLCAVLRGDTDFVSFAILANLHIKPRRATMPELGVHLETIGEAELAHKLSFFLPGERTPTSAGEFVRHKALRSKRWKEKLNNATNCFYCLTPVVQLSTSSGKSPSYRLTWDHVRLRKDGGRLSLENLVPCCQFCNNLRADRDYLEFGFDAIHVVRPLRHDMPALARAFERTGRARDAKVTRSHHVMTVRWEGGQVQRAAQGLVDLRPDWRKSQETKDAA